MLSAVILSEHSYPAMLLAQQPAHQGFVHFGPLVLEAASFKSPTPTADRDRSGRTSGGPVVAPAALPGSYVRKG